MMRGEEERVKEVKEIMKSRSCCTDCWKQPDRLFLDQSEQV